MAVITELLLAKDTQFFPGTQRRASQIHTPAASYIPPIYPSWRKFRLCCLGRPVSRVYCSQTRSVQGTPQSESQSCPHSSPRYNLYCFCELLDTGQTCPCVRRALWLLPLLRLPLRPRGRKPLSSASSQANVITMQCLVAAGRTGPA